jgi:hypothetical protein
MFTILASSYVAEQAVERAAAVRINSVIIQKPGIALFGFIKNGLYSFYLRHE